MKPPKTIPLLPLKMAFVFCCGILLSACSEEEKSDAYGNFEATTITISAQGMGPLLQFGISEGQTLEAGAQIGLIDTMQLHLEKALLQARLSTLTDKLKEAAPEVAVLLERKANLERERKRLQSLIKDKAATQKQLDDLEGEMEVVIQQIAAIERQTSLANRSILSERKPLQAQIDLIDYKISQHRIINPVAGTVLTKLVEPAEYVSPGKPLYRLANLQELRLRAYTSANFLPQIRLNGEVTVLVDDGKGGQKSLKGRVSWVASEAEFTPETIETRENRVDLVYALEVLVPNDGSLKIGMPAEVMFAQPSQP